MKRYVHAVAASCLLAVGCVGGARAQVHPAQVPPIEEILESFARYNAARGTPEQNQMNSGPLLGILSDPAQYGGHLVEPVLEGLERLALKHPSVFTRQAAAAWLSSAGDMTPMGTGLRRLDVVARMQRVYAQSTESVIRDAIIDRLAMQANVPEAVRLLSEIASTNREEDRRSEFPEPYLAINGLAKMGSAGHEALRDLLSQGRVRNPRARDYLQYLAERNFRPPPR